MRPPRFARRLAVALLCAGWAATAPAGAQDRLERFRAVAREELAVATDAAERERAVSQLYELVDGEVLDSLHGEEPFSSLVFIRDRLDAMMEAWGGATLRVLRIPAAGARGPVTVGLYSLTGVEGSGSLRLYAGSGPSATLAAASTHDGLLDAQVWPAGPDRVARVLALWSGPPAVQGLRGRPRASGPRGSGSPTGGRSPASWSSATSRAIRDGSRAASARPSRRSTIA